MNMEGTALKETMKLPPIEIVPNNAIQKRGLYTPQVTQARVIAASLAGRSNREIARQEKLNRGTIARILSQPEVSVFVEFYRQQLLLLAPAAIRALEQKILSGKADWRMLIELLKGLGILNYRAPDAAAKYDEFKDRSRAELEYARVHGYWPEDAAGRRQIDIAVDVET